MQINTFIWSSVGADLSGTSPIYRPSLAFLVSRSICSPALSCTSPIYRPKALRCPSKADKSAVR